MANTSRNIARKALAALLQAALEWVGKLAVTVFDHVPPKFTASPVVCVGSLGTAPGGKGLGNQGTSKAVFRFQIMNFVAVGESDTYTAATADDLLDDIEAVVRGVVMANPSNAAWSIMRFAGQQTSTQAGDRTRIVPVKVAGQKYNLEVITVDIEVYDA